MTNSDQLKFSEKEMIVDEKRNPVPQYYNEDIEAFHPNTRGEPLTAMGDNDNPYQPNFSSKRLIVDKQGRVIPQYYDVANDVFVPVTFDTSGGGGGTPGPLPTGLVKSVNLIMPDGSGNVQLPPVPPLQYQYIDPIPPMNPQTDYPDGTTAFITEFIRADMPDWAAVFNNPDIPDGDMMVVTYKYNNGSPHCYQAVDTLIDGVFTAQFSRSWDFDNSEWTPLTSVSPVLSVNGEKPDVEGNVNIRADIPIGRTITEQELFDPQMRTSGDYLVLVSTGAQLPSTQAMFVRVSIIETDDEGVYGKIYQAVEIMNNTTTNGYWIRMDVLFDEPPYVQEDVFRRVGGGGGVKWIVGIGEPNQYGPTLGDEGDYYLQADNGDVWNKSNGSWINTGANLKGPKGDKGETGDTGPQGPKGDEGPPGKGVEIVPGYTMGDLPSDYQEGITTAILGPGEDGHSDALNAFNTIMFWGLRESEVVFLINTYKGEDGSVIQVLQALLSDYGRIVGTLTRSANAGDTYFSSFHGAPSVFGGLYEPGENIFTEGMYGNIYLHVPGRTMYMRDGSESDRNLNTPGNNNWKPLSPKIVNNTYSPVPEDMESVYSAYTVNELFTDHDNKKASTTQLGHVMVDGSTINIDSNGKISSQNVYRINQSILPDTDITNIPQGTTRDRFLAYTTSPEKEAWLAVVNNKFEWACTSEHIGFEVETTRITNDIDQEVRIFLRVTGIANARNARLIARLQRKYVGNDWRGWHAEQVMGQGNYSPLNAEYGLRGSTFYQSNTSTFWTIEDINATTPTNTAWEQVIHKGHKETLASSSQLGHVRINPNISSITSFNGLIDVKPATNYDRGAVKPDGVTTIITGDGVITAVNQTKIFNFTMPQGNIVVNMPRLSDYFSFYFRRPAAGEGISLFYACSDPSKIDFQYIGSDYDAITGELLHSRVFDEIGTTAGFPIHEVISITGRSECSFFLRDLETTKVFKGSFYFVGDGTRFSMIWNEI